MKNLYKKISAVVLAGIIISGGCLSSGLSIHASEVSKEDMEKYDKNIYSGQLPDSEFLQRIPLVGLFGDDNNPEVKKQIEEINAACNGSNLSPLKLSSEFGVKDGKKLGIDGFLDGIEEALSKIKDGEKLLKEPEAFFDNVGDFKRYLEECSEQIESGLYKIQIRNVQGIFKGRSGKPE